VILVTIGTMLPFDRLVEAMDHWAGEHASEEIFAQIGSGKYEPRNMPWTRLLDPEGFAERVRVCSLIVAHAGTGSFFLAAEMTKPIVMMPRLATHREHTTDHQVHTARWLRQKPGVYVAMTADELPEAIHRAITQGSVAVAQLTPFAPESFLSQIRRFLVA
jgi:UDP-N-acetylglucosamine transferase subunit ALG13